MTYSVIIQPKAQRSLEQLPKNYLKIIFSHIERLRYFSFSMTNIKKMSGVDHGYRLRAGNYRILFQVDETLKRITIYSVGHRKEIYRGI